MFNFKGTPLSPGFARGIAQVYSDIPTALANVGSREDAERADEAGADRIGLFRTEGFFLAAKTLPSAYGFSKYLLHCLEPIGKSMAEE